MPAHTASWTRISPMAVFQAEHQFIHQVLACLQAMAREPDWRELAEIQEVMEVFVLRCHHGKEERCLFAMLEELRPELTGLETLREEHRQIRSAHRALVECIIGWNSDRLRKVIRNLVDLVSLHQTDEEQDLFPQAEVLLDADLGWELLTRMRAYEHDLLGTGTHERMIAAADRLAERHGIPRADSDPSTRILLLAACGCHATPASAEHERLVAWALAVSHAHGQTQPQVLNLQALVIMALRQPDEDVWDELRQRLDHYRPWPGACGTALALCRRLSELDPQGSSLTGGDS